MNWLKENWFKVGVLLALLTLSYIGYGNKDILSLGQPSKEKLLELAIQCRKDGEISFEEDKDTATRNKYSTGILDCYYMEPVFIFNQKLNTCLYSGGWTCDLDKLTTEGFEKGSYPVRWSRRIVDVYSNKSLDDVYVDDSSNVEEWNMEMINDFWETYEELGFE